MKARLIFIISVLLFYKNASAQTLLVPINPSDFFVDSNCSDRGDAGSIDFQYNYVLRASEEKIRSFFKKAHQDLYNRMTTPIEYKYLFSEPYRVNYGNIEINEWQKGINRDDYNFRETCSSFRERYTNARIQLSLKISTKIGMSLLNLYGECFRQDEFTLESKLIFTFTDGTERTYETNGYFSPDNVKRNSSARDASECAGQEKPEWPPSGN